MSKITALFASLIGFSILLAACEPAGTGRTGTPETTPTPPPADSPGVSPTVPTDPTVSPPPSP
ncbi:hypothetical protein HJG54_33640 [Leptolyngbya sp. NK1-12]|uniref:Beta-Ig-H3/fasciclin n=1 Tax=Leptolyngbya sp. NK1-12 TaxID=2547451 RepID=A0AA97AKF3_9CYAN|nr:hypothetical protein [Leptolyngbya sp. NK1-12]WNZ27779.1 hypothetical protein HJG54_33640 [Leptolyngbya sp. NK1-12]